MTLIVDRLNLSVADKVLVRDMSFSVEAGSVLAIMGPSGSGKSSILDFLSGTLGSSFSSTGKVILNNRDISGLTAHKRKVGLQLQDHLLFPHLNVAENLAFGLPASYRGKARKERVDQALNDCQLPDVGQFNPMTLSGGQRARISLMRTLLSEPDALLLDEPFSKLDPELREQFRQFVFDQVKGLDIPVVMVTHDLADVMDKSQLLKMSGVC